MLKHKAAAVVLLTLFVANNYKAARACAQYNGFTVQTLQSVLNMPGGGVYGTIEAPNTAFYGLWNSDNPSPAFSAPYVQSVTGETDGSGKYQVLNGRAPAYWNFLIQSGPCDGDTTVIPGTTDENIPVVNGMITSLICEANTPVGGGVSISPSPITRESGKAYIDSAASGFFNTANGPFEVSVINSAGTVFASGAVPKVDSSQELSFGRMPGATLVGNYMLVVYQCPPGGSYKAMALGHFHYNP